MGVDSCSLLCVHSGPKVSLSASSQTLSLRTLSGTGDIFMVLGLLVLNQFLELIPLVSRQGCVLENLVLQIRFVKQKGVSFSRYGMSRDTKSF